jgi:hypothetical protein
MAIPFASLRAGLAMFFDGRDARATSATVGPLLRRDGPGGMEITQRLSPREEVPIYRAPSPVDYTC